MCISMDESLPTYSRRHRQFYDVLRSSPCCRADGQEKFGADRRVEMAFIWLLPVTVVGLFGIGFRRIVSGSEELSGRWTYDNRTYDKERVESNRCTVIK